MFAFYTTVLSRGIFGVQSPGTPSCDVMDLDNGLGDFLVVRFYVKHPQNLNFEPT